MEFSSTSDGSTLKLSSPHRVQQGQKFESFDFLRAFFSLVIVAYKTKIVNIPKMLVPNGLTQWFSDYILSGMVGAMAVPVFFQISLFLFYLKSEKQGLAYFIHTRLPRLISLYLFWVTLITVFDVLFVNGFTVISEATSSLKSFIMFIVSGHNTPYFFFFSLVFVTIIAEAVTLLLERFSSSLLRAQISYSLLFLSSLLIFTLSTVQPLIQYIGHQSPLLSALDNITSWDYTPINFLPYAFTAAITAQEYNEGKLETFTASLKRKLWILGALTLTFFMLEWILTSNGLLIQVDQAPLDHYMRLSLVFGSWLILYLSLLSKRKVAQVFQFLSACSLGIYGFHVFFIFQGPPPLTNLPLIGGLFQFPVMESIAMFLITLIGSILLDLCCKRTKFLKRFV